MGIKYDGNAYWTRIKNRAMVYGISLREVADKAGIEATYFYTASTRKTVFEMPRTIRIAKVLGVSPEYLLTGKDTSPFTEKEADIVQRFQTDMKFKILLVKILDFSEDEIRKLSDLADEIIATH